MKLADFIDIDRELYLDPLAGNARDRLERDRGIGRTLAPSPAGNEDQSLLLDWKNNLSPPGNHSPGVLMEGAVRWTGFFLTFIGLLAGVSAAATFLHYDGSQPINVLFFLGAIVGVQLFLLPLLILTLIFKGRLRHGLRLTRDLVGGLLTQILALLARLGTSHEKTVQLRADLGALRAGNSLFSRVQPVLTLLLIQVFGLAFNVAVAATLLFFVLFSDLTFSWGTTVQVEPGQVHRITSLLSAPWGGVFPQARPSLELVESTRFVRMTGEFTTAEPGAARRAGGWWPFLLACTISYGLLPRLLALAACLVSIRLEMQRALSSSSQVQALKERLNTPLVRMDANPVDDSPKMTGVVPDVLKTEVTGRGLNLAAVFWAFDELPSEVAIFRLIQERIGATVALRLCAGGIDTAEEDVLTEVNEAKAKNDIGGVVAFFESFEPPKTDARRFLLALRKVLGVSAPIVVFLAEFVDGEIAPVGQENWNAWNNAIRSMGDPYLLLAEGQVIQ